MDFLFPSTHKVNEWRRRQLHELKERAGSKEMFQLWLAVEVDENKWKIVDEREAINICQYLSSIKI